MGLQSPLTVETDVLVIGGGAAGARAAIEARDQGARVLLVNKGFLGRTGITASTTGGIGGFIQQPDNPEIYFQDIVKCGRHINNKDIVRLFVKEIADGNVMELEQFGVTFDRDAKNKLRVLKMGGHSFPRMVMATWLNAPAILRYGLIPQMLKKGVQVIDQVVITKILLDGGQVSGAMGINLKMGRSEVFRSKSIILATGNAGQLFGESAGLSATGDGYSLAYQAGARLRDMEFVSCSIGLAYPLTRRGKVLGEPATRKGSYPILYNSKREFFMRQYFPDALQGYTKDMYMYGISKEVREGRGTPHGGVWVDFSNLDPTGPSYPVFKEFMSSLTLDAQKGSAIECILAPYYFPGGVEFDENHESTIRGLFAAGEASGGLHGAERLASTSMAETIVFGKRAGCLAAYSALQKSRSAIDWEAIRREEQRLYQMLDQEGENLPIEVRKKIQKTMWNKVGFIRNGVKLSSAKEDLEAISSVDLRRTRIRSKNPKGNLDWLESIENGFLLDVAHMVVGASLARQESRGSHYREDFPEQRDVWVKKIAISKDQGGMRFSIEDV